MENLTPPAAGQKRTGWSTASAGRAAGSGAAGTVAPGSVPAPAPRHRNGEQTATAHDMHRDAPGAADRTASADRRPEQQRTTRRRPGLFLLPIFQPCRLPGLPDQQQTGPARCPRRPPDDHASAPPPQQITPPTCTTCQQQTSTSTSAAPMTPQPISCTACPLPTASSQQRQTSQQPAPAACTYQQHQRTPQPCRLPAAADQHHPRPPNGPKPAHRGPLPEGSDSLPDRHIDFAV